MWHSKFRLFVVAGFLSLVLCSGLFAQEAPLDTPTLTPKEQALQLLDSLEQNSNDQQNLINQSQTDLQTALKNSAKLKDSLKRTVSYSQSLEQSLNFSQMVNKIAVPVGGAAILVAVVEGLVLVLKH